MALVEEPDELMRVIGINNRKATIIDSQPHVFTAARGAPSVEIANL
jgi:hypothetical protein